MKLNAYFQKNKEYIGTMFMALLVSFLLLLAAVWLFQNNSRQILLTNMHIIAEHDMWLYSRAFKGYTDELHAVGERLRMAKHKNTEDLQGALLQERSSMGRRYRSLLLVSDQGELYTDHFTVERPLYGASDSSEQARILKDALRSKEDFQRGYNNLTDPNDQYETMATVVHLSRPIVAGNKMFIKIIGTSDIATVDMVVRESSEYQGKTSLIDRDGYYIVNSSNTSGLRQHDHISMKIGREEFNKLQEWMEEYDNPELQQALEKLTNRHRVNDTVTVNGRSIALNRNIDYEDKEGKPYHIVIMPSNQKGWFVVEDVAMDVFAITSQSFTMPLVVLFILVVTIMVFSVIRLIKMQQKNEEIRLEALRDQAMAKAQKEFLSSMSHEIRTPLNGIIGLNRLMHNSMEDKSKLEDYLGKSERTAKYLLNLLNDILDLSKLESGKVEIVDEEVNLLRVCEQMDIMMHDRMKANSNTFSVDCRGVQKPYIRSDGMHLQQMLLNIIGNAAKFTKNGSVDLTVWQEEQDEKHVINKFRIRDTGCGMTPEFLEHIWDAFSQDRRTVSDGTKGTGLGMNITHQIAVKMGGTIEVTSEVGKGSEFLITLPSLVAEQETEKPAAAETEVKKLRPEELHILAAEDNELNSEILVSILEEAGFKVDLAVNGREAVELFQGSEPFGYDVILMDCLMPEMDGYEATRAIRALDRPDAGIITIIACTANALAEDREKALSAGMDDFLGKPIDVDMLLRKLEKLQGGAKHA